MANVIKLKRGSGSDPSASDMVLGEPVLRTDTAELFFKKDNGTVAKVSGGGGGGGSDIFINTLSSSSGSGGGSATFNGTATRFTLSNPPSVSAQQLLVSINGVIQKPNSGASPSEGFAIDGNDIIFASAPNTGSDFFIVTYGSLNIAVPADNSVTSAKIADGAIVNADINASAAIAGTKIDPDFGSQNIATTGSLGANGFGTHGGEISLTGTIPRINFTDSNANSDFRIKVDGGSFQIEDITNSSADRLVIDSSGRVQIGTTIGWGSNCKLHVSNTSSNCFITISAADNGNSVLAFSDTAATVRGALDYDHDGDFLGIKTAGSERMRINSSGKIGINQTVPTEMLHVRDNGNSDVFGGIIVESLNQTARVKYGWRGLDGNNNVRIATGGTERMRIDSSGNVGIGTTSPANVLDVRGSAHAKVLVGTTGTGHATGLQISHAQGNAALQEWQLQTDASADGNLIIRNATTGTATMFFDSDNNNVGIGTTSPQQELHVVGDSDACVRLTCTDGGAASFQLGDASDTVIGGITLDSSDNSLQLRGNNNTERLRIDSSGNTFVNCTSDPLSANSKFVVQHGGDGQSVATFDFDENFSRPNMFIKHARAGAVSGTRVAKMIAFLNLSGTEVGSIESGISSTAFNTSSDYRLKENITNISDGITRIKQLIPKKFSFIGDGNKTLKDGFLAHEVSSVVPEAITGTKDEVDENNEPVYQGIDQSKLVPLLVAALQEAIGRIEVLEAK